jgi:hypothetical protein
MGMLLKHRRIYHTGGPIINAKLPAPGVRESDGPGKTPVSLKSRRACLLTNVIYLIKLLHVFRLLRHKIIINGGRHMKQGTALFLIVFVLLAFVGVAMAAEMSGEVTAVNPVTGALTLKSGAVEAGFDCEGVSLIKNVKVGDQVTVEYKEAGGKKIVTKITPMMKKKAPVGC